MIFITWNGDLSMKTAWSRQCESTRSADSRTVVFVHFSNNPSILFLDISKGMIISKTLEWALEDSKNLKKNSSKKLML